MARRQVLSLILLVLGLHLALLDWLGQSLPTASVLKPVVKAMFTREIVQAEAPIASATAPIAPKPKQKSLSRHIPYAASATTSIANTTTQVVTAPDDALPHPETSAPTAASPTASVTTSLGTVTSTATAALGPTTGPAPKAPDESFAKDWPGNTRLSYGLTGYYRGAVRGDAQVQWLKDQERYQVSVEIDLGLISTRMTSQGSIGKDRLEPQVYEEKTGPTLRSLLLDPKRIRLMGGEWVERPAEVQDTASQFVDLANRFAKQPALLAVGKAVPVWLARPGGVDEWTYDVVGLEQLHSEHLGTVPAFHLKPRPLAKPRGPVTAEIWFAPSLQYLPVRIRLSIGADAWLDLMVEKIEQQ